MEAMLEHSIYYVRGHYSRTPEGEARLSQKPTYFTKSDEDYNSIVYQSRIIKSGERNPKPSAFAVNTSYEPVAGLIFMYSNQLSSCHSAPPPSAL